MPRPLDWSVEMDAKLAALLDHKGGTIRKAASNLGVSRSFIQRRAKMIAMKKHSDSCTPARQAAGDAPLPVGHPISWEALMRAPARVCLGAL
ncbi:hypothetical protein FHR90_002857 [Endobacter medicaginis]|jgi:hypothetical protein|uniref:Uncharacterized protein n=1 Tax=Endobacter medicaginis TaxID=1181271 RepID=A0A850NLR5_9PROT|nr:hypothetical protein [Endobacter medicaginis]MBB3175010.1 hypothetical protein [Endobacter medicaginis]MCX5475932.1 hypothetical protein [Endobacter medicaginis]NVN28860.1 hypothetical protein [Endobacter medicaginis]